MTTQKFLEVFCRHMRSNFSYSVLPRNKQGSECHWIAKAQLKKSWWANYNKNWNVQPSTSLHEWLEYINNAKILEAFKVLIVIVIPCRQNKSKNRKHMSLIGSKLNICREHSNSSNITWLTWTTKTIRNVCLISVLLTDPSSGNCVCLPMEFPRKRFV